LLFITESRIICGQENSWQGNPIIGVNCCFLCSGKLSQQKIDKMVGLSY